MIEDKGLLEIQPRPEVFIQFACAADQTASGVGDTGRNCLFAKHLLSNITEKNVDIAEVFRRISDSVCQKSKHEQQPLSMNGLNKYNTVYLNEVTSGMYKGKFKEFYSFFRKIRIVRLYFSVRSLKYAAVPTPIVLFTAIS
jgi:hypothetical protein